MGMWQNELVDFCLVCQRDTHQEAWNDNDDTGTHIDCQRCGHEISHLVHNFIGDVIVIDDKPYRIVKNKNDEFILVEYEVEVDEDYEDPEE